MFTAPLLLLVSQVIDLEPPRTVAMIRMSPKALERPLSSERMFSSAAGALGPGSTVAFVSAEQAGIDEARLSECELERRLSCWASEVDRRADYLVVLSMLETKDGATEISGFLLDVAASLGKSENEIFERTAVVRKTVDLDRDDALEAYFAELLPRTLARTPKGAIAIDSDRAELSIAIDGAVVGVAGAGVTTIRGVSPGARSVALIDAGSREPLQTAAIEVRADAVARVAYRTPTEAESSTFRRATLIGGISVAVVGVAIAGAAIGVAASSSVERCVAVGSRGDCPAGAGFYAPGGVLLAPLGFSLFGAGGLAALGAALLPDDDLWIALSIVAGVAVGAAAYGVSAALNP